jgi:hypothetical protein
MAAELEPRNSTKVGGVARCTREKLERQQREREAMQQAIAAYTGPITKCPPGKAAEGPPRRRASFTRPTEKRTHSEFRRYSVTPISPRVSPTKNDPTGDRVASYYPVATRISEIFSITPVSSRVSMAFLTRRIYGADRTLLANFGQRRESTRGK